MKYVASISAGLHRLKLAGIITTEGAKRGRAGDALRRLKLAGIITTEGRELPQVKHRVARLKLAGIITTEGLEGDFARNVDFPPQARWNHHD